MCASRGPRLFDPVGDPGVAMAAANDVEKGRNGGGKYWKTIQIWRYCIISLVHSAVWVPNTLTTAKSCKIGYLMGLVLTVDHMGLVLCLGMYSHILRLWLLWLEIFYVYFPAHILPMIIPIWGFPKMGVPHGTPKLSIFIAFAMINHPAIGSSPWKLPTIRSFP